VEALLPILAAILRFCAAAFPALLFIRPPRAPWYPVAGLGLAFGFALHGFHHLSIAWGMSAGLSSLVLHTQAFFIMALAFVILGERPTRFKVIGALVVTVLRRRHRRFPPGIRKWPPRGTAIWRLLRCGNSVGRRVECRHIERRGDWGWHGRRLQAVEFANDQSSAAIGIGGVEFGLGQV
jgi:hypothetical protein